MRCGLCGKTGQEADLYRGVYENKIIDICKTCAQLEDIPLIKKPTQEQLDKANKKYSVKERIEKISGFDKTRQLSKEQIIANKNLAKLKFPEKKQESKKLVENYYWEIQIARRRLKISINQLSKKTGIPVEIINNIEKGILPENPENIMKILENTLNIKLLRYPFSMPEVKFKPEIKEEIIEIKPEQIEITKDVEIEKEIKNKEYKKEEKSEKKEIIRKISRGEFDFSDRKNLEKVTLNDLINLKKEKEKREMFGDDLEIEDD